MLGTLPTLALGAMMFVVACGHARHPAAAPKHPATAKHLATARSMRSSTAVVDHAAMSRVDGLSANK
jgi:hypothetical protein